MSAPEARILVVEDSEAIREAVLAALDDAGHRSTGLVDGTTLEKSLSAFRPDLVILDVMLPGARDGFALIPVVRRTCDAGIVMLTARDELTDRLRGLDGGADDYILKPFAIDEVVSRVGAVLRRLGRIATCVEVGDLMLDLDAGVAARAGSALDLTATELRLLDHLVSARGRVLSKNQILDAVWGYDSYDPNLVEVYISALRRKLEAHGPRMIHTQRGLGYTLRAAP